MRHNIWIPADLWPRIVRSATTETGRTGKPVSASEIIRRAVLAYLTKQERKP